MEIHRSGNALPTMGLEQSLTLLKHTIKYFELFAKIYISCLAHALTRLATQKGCIERQAFIIIVYMSPCPNAKLSPITIIDEMAWSLVLP